MPSDSPQVNRRSRASRVRIACVYFALGVTVLAAAESAAQILFTKIRAKVRENVERSPRYTCVQTVNRSQFVLPQSGSSCSTVIERSERALGDRLLRQHDRLRLDVAIGETGEMYSWAGASQFESGDITQLVGHGATGSGEFGSFLAGVFGGEAEGFLYRGLRDMPYGRVSSFDFTVPLTKSHYDYTSDGKNYKTVAYHGSFFADSDSAELKELDIEAADFPAAERVCRIEDKIRYAQVKIGQNDFMLPANSSMDVIYRNGTETLNEATYAGCREYVGESTLRFDLDENGNAPEAAVRPELRPLPPKVHLRVKIDPPVSSATAAAGDPITGVVEFAVKQKNVTIVKPGDKLLGRIVRLEQVLLPNPHWTVAVLFETIERNGIQEKVQLRPVDDGDRTLSAAIAGRRGGPSTAAPSFAAITAERPPGGGIYVLSEPGTLVLGPKFESEWETR